MAQDSVGISHDDVAVTLAVRQDLGPGHEPAVIAEFLDRVGLAIDERVDVRLTAGLRGKASGEQHDGRLAFFSLIFGIPITAIASGHGIGALAISWGGIAAVNVADRLRR